MTKFRAKIDIKFDAEDIDDAFRVLSHAFAHLAQGDDIEVWFCEGRVEVKPCKLEGGDENE